ncbi:MAG: hypothetical protein WC680_11305 [Sulfuricurvum sp.]|jgi:hypothetical protein
MQHPKSKNIIKGEDMKAFDKVIESIKKPQINGHAQANIENRKSLAKAKTELENILMKRKEMGSEEKKFILKISILNQEVWMRWVRFSIVQSSKLLLCYICAMNFFYNLCHKPIKEVIL